jgi:hypothetical protein
MDFNSPIILNQLQETYYGPGFISFLDSSCISFIHSIENQDYYAISGRGIRLFKEYPCLKLGDIWPSLKQTDFFFLYGESGKILSLVNGKNITCIMGNTVYFSDNGSLNINGWGPTEIQEFAKSIKEVKNLL